MNMETEQGYFVRHLLIICAVVIITILLVVGVLYVFDVVLLLFGAILIAVFLRSLADLLNRYTQIPVNRGVLIVTLTLLTALGLGIWFLAPSVSEQIGGLRDSFPRALDSFRERLSQYSWGNFVIEQIPPFEQLLDTFITGGFLARLGGFFSTTVGIAAKALIVIVLGIYLASEPKSYIQGFLKLFPLNKRDRVCEVINELGETLRWWLIGKLISMLIIGTLTTVGLTIIGVEMALTLGIFTAIMEFIPNFGPFIAAVPAILIALAESPTQALYVAILFFCIQMLESYLITPLIERKTVFLPPVLTIFFQLLLGVLMGGIGLILATPLLAVIIVLVKMLYVEDVLGDSVALINDDAEGEETEN
jgi:predicted PurR-regulated permease PerM